MSSDSDRHPPLIHIAAGRGFVRLAKLLAARGADVNERRTVRIPPHQRVGPMRGVERVEGVTPLFEAAKMGQTEMVVHLIASGGESGGEMIS